MEMAFAVALEKFACQALELKDVRFLDSLTLPDMQVRLLRLRLFDQRGDGAAFQVAFVQEDKSEMLLSDGKIVADLLNHEGSQKTCKKLQGENQGISDFVYSFFFPLVPLPNSFPSLN